MAEPGKTPARLRMGKIDSGRQPHQKTCAPNEIEVKSPKKRGRQLSIKDISSVMPEPTRGWNESATTKIMFV